MSLLSPMVCIMDGASSRGLRAYDTKHGRAVFRLRDHMVRFLDSSRFMQLEVSYGRRALRGGESMQGQRTTGRLYPPIGVSRRERNRTGVVKVPTNVVIMTIHMGAQHSGDEPGASLITSSWERPSNLATSLTAKICGNYISSIIARRRCGKARTGADAEPQRIGRGGSAENLFMVRHGRSSPQAFRTASSKANQRYGH